MSQTSWTKYPVMHVCHVSNYVRLSEQWHSRRLYAGAKRDKYFKIQLSIFIFSMPAASSYIVRSVFVVCSYIVRSVFVVCSYIVRSVFVVCS